MRPKTTRPMGVERVRAESGMVLGVRRAAMKKIVVAARRMRSAVISGAEFGA